MKILKLRLLRKVRSAMFNAAALMTAIAKVESVWLSEAHREKSQQRSYNCWTGFLVDLFLLYDSCWAPPCDLRLFYVR